MPPSFSISSLSRRLHHGAPRNKQSISMTKQSSDDGPESLMTTGALRASLSAPRAPPMGTAHHALLMNRDASSTPWADTEEAHGQSSHASLRRRLREQIQHSQNRLALRLPHPHLAAGPELGDQMTRLLGVLLPLSTQNDWRDSGTFRTISDGLVTASAPLIAAFHPSVIPRFLKLTSKLKVIRYGPHERQTMDVFFPPFEGSLELPEAPSRLVFFIHGGAWGSGAPWMYRLVAQPFLDEGWAVAIPGYRTYPDGNVANQVDDCEQAAKRLQLEYPELCQGRVTVVGHSSGAHVALLMLVDHVRRQLSGEEDTEEEFALKVDSFIGLSGPYSISHHFDYEAARGVEELSPLKPANGYTREAFRKNSPVLRLKGLLAEITESERDCVSSLAPKMLLVHGVEDTTVPFTATSEAGSTLRACGVSECEEMYVAETGHQDTVMHFMVGGRSQRPVIDWIKRLSLPDPSPLAATTMVTNSKL